MSGALLVGSLECFSIHSFIHFSNILYLPMSPLSLRDFAIWQNRPSQSCRHFSPTYHSWSFWIWCSKSATHAGQDGTETWPENILNREWKKSLKGQINYKVESWLVFSNVNVHASKYFANVNAYTNHLGNLVNLQILIGQFWGETWDAAFPTNSRDCGCSRLRPTRRGARG